MKVKENLEILIDIHPQSESLNKKLIIESDGLVDRLSLPNSYYSNIQGKKKNLTSDKNSPSRLVLEWVKSLIRNRYHHPDQEKMEYQIGGWFAEYDKGNSCRAHDHIPFAIFSFVYFVNSPRGSSPLVFTTSGKRIKAEAGKVIIFPASLMHSVPKNKCEKRLVLAGHLLASRMGKQ